MAEHAVDGERIDHYRLEEVIGVGSFSTVHRAVDERLDSTVVIKILAENHSLNPEIRERFIAEGRSLRRVEGAHVVTIHDIGESSRQQPYLVLEHADRGTVQQRVSTLWRQGWRATGEDMLAFARPLATAVDSVHRAQLVHRDLSPGNLLLASRPSELISDEARGVSSRLLADDERLLVADLGMCKDLAMNSGLTVSGGTAGFRPPEQNGPGVVDTRADVWAISAVMRWLAQGAELPRAFEKIIDRGLATRPDQRQKDPATWLAELEDSLTPPPEGPAPEPAPNSPVRFTQPSSGMGNTPGQARRPFRTALVLGAVMLLAGLTGLLTGYMVSGSDDPVTETAAASIAVEGPEEIQVGETATFTAETEGVDSWVWVLPTGAHIADEPEAVLTATSAGTAEIVLRTRAPDGTELEAQYTVTVVE